MDKVHLDYENKTLDGQSSCMVTCSYEGEDPDVIKFDKTME